MATLGDFASKASIFLLPLSLRRVKDPTYLAQAMQVWHRQDPRVHLMLVGEPSEPAVTAQVQALAKETEVWIETRDSLHRRFAAAAVLGWAGSGFRIKESLWTRVDQIGGVWQEMARLYGDILGSPISKSGEPEKPSPPLTAPQAPN